MKCGYRVSRNELTHYVFQRNKYILMSEIQRKETKHAEELTAAKKLRLYLDIDNTTLYCDCSQKANLDDVISPPQVPTD